MPKALLALLICVAAFLPLAAVAGAPVPAAPAAPEHGAPAAASDASLPPIPTTPGELDLYIFHKPDCHICQKIVALKPDMEKLEPKLRVILVNNTITGAAERAVELRRMAKVQAEGWGAATVVFLGDGWPTSRGEALIEELHALLADRAEISPQAWITDTFELMMQTRDKIKILGDFRLLQARMMLRVGLREGLSFPALATLLVLTVALVGAAAGPRQVLGLGLAYWGASVLVLLGSGLQGLAPVFERIPYLVLSWSGVGYYVVLALILLALALRRRRAYRAGEAAAPAGEEPSSAVAGPPRRLGAAVLIGLLLGLVATFIGLLVRWPHELNLIIEVWGLGGLPASVMLRDLGMLACYIAVATAPLLVVALGAWLFSRAAARGRRLWRTEAEPAYAAFLLHLVVSAFLLAQSLVLVLGRLSPEG